jgi:hypothetical protein
MSDPGKVIVAVSFFTSLAMIARFITSAAVAYHRGSDARGRDATGRALVVDDERLTRLEQAVESIALEVERISEGQRFTTKLLADRAQVDPRRVASPSEPIRHTTPH